LSCNIIRAAIVALWSDCTQLISSIKVKHTRLIWSFLLPDFQPFLFKLLGRPTGAIPSGCWWSSILRSSYKVCNYRER